VVSGSRREGPDVLSGELASELLAARLIATLGTFARDGAIHLVPMWFLWDGSHVLIPTSHSAQKVRNLERDPRASVMIDDSRSGLDLRGITIIGEASIVRAPTSFGLNRTIHLKYITAGERDMEVVDAYLGTDDVTLRIRPHRAFNWDLRNTPAGRALLGAGSPG
jgi:PPOX class probable F420-dependent enzyme